LRVYAFKELKHLPAGKHTFKAREEVRLYSTERSEKKRTENEQYQTQLQTISLIHFGSYAI